MCELNWLEKGSWLSGKRGYQFRYSLITGNVGDLYSHNLPCELHQLMAHTNRFDQDIQVLCLFASSSVWLHWLKRSENIHYSIWSYYSSACAVRILSGPGLANLMFWSSLQRVSNDIDNCFYGFSVKWNCLAEQSCFVVFFHLILTRGWVWKTFQ